MQRFFIVLIMVVFISSLCLAQETRKPQPITIETIQGTVDSVTTGSGPEITVITEKGKKKIIPVQDTTLIYDVNGKPITLDSIAKDTKVSIRCSSNSDGIRKILSINEIKDFTRQRYF